MIKKLPFYKQIDSKDCGPTCLKIITKHYNKKIDFKQEMRGTAEIITERFFYQFREIVKP
jgi:ATP-binding cassette subfamily B protein